MLPPFEAPTSAARYGAAHAGRGSTADVCKPVFTGYDAWRGTDT